MNNQNNTDKTRNDRVIKTVCITTAIVGSTIIGYGLGARFTRNELGGLTMLGESLLNGMNGLALDDTAKIAFNVGNAGDTIEYVLTKVK